MGGFEGPLAAGRCRGEIRLEDEVRHGQPFNFTSTTCATCSLLEHQKQMHTTLPKRVAGLEIDPKTCLISYGTMESAPWTFAQLRTDVRSAPLTCSRRVKARSGERTIGRIATNRELLWAPMNPEVRSGFSDGKEQPATWRDQERILTQLLWSMPCSSPLSTFPFSSTEASFPSLDERTTDI